MSEICIKYFKIDVKKKWPYFFIALFTFSVLIYIVVRRENIYIEIHDNLDSNIAILKMMKEQHLFGKLKATAPYLGGIDRNYLFSDLKIYSWLYMIFPAFWAMIIGWGIKIAVSTVGFFFLGKTLFDNYSDKHPLTIWCGFLYGILPTFPTASFSFASLPALLFLFALYYKQYKHRYLIFFLLYPLISDFVSFGIFICGYIVLFFLIDWIVNKRPLWRMLIATGILSIGYIITEWRLFYTIFFSEEATIRETFKSTQNVSILEGLKSSIEVFIYGHYHSGDLHTFILLPVCMIYFLYLNLQFFKKREYSKIVRDVFNWIFLWIIFNSLIYGMDKVTIFKRFVSIVIPPLSGFSFARTLWFNPFLWYLAFAIILCRLKKEYLGMILGLLAFCVICLQISTYNEIYHNIRMTEREIFHKEKNVLDYSEFYAEELFDEIKKNIGYSGEWSVAYGMHPSILVYNGISTLDGYSPFYSAGYKKTFRELIDPELEIDSDNRDYYDDWGGRAYLFSKEISFGPNRQMEKEEANLFIDPDVFAKMKGEYIFSRVGIKNAKDLRLKEVGVFQNDKTPYTIYVYHRIKAENSV